MVSEFPCKEAYYDTGASNMILRTRTFWPLSLLVDGRYCCNTKTVSVFWPLSRSPRGVNRRSGSSVTDIVLCARRVVHLFTLHLGHFPGVLLFVWPIRYHRRRKKRLNSHWGWVRFSALIFRTNGKGASKSKQRHFRKAPDQISPKNASFARYWRELFPFSKNRAL